ncbi:MAG TPA: nodulation protein NfeD, partial [Syntrophales bacterium]|nr:nodulation protein NfeD [Syntrophales bacterium]
MKKTGWIFCLTLIGLGLLLPPGSAAPPGGEAPVYHVLTVNAPITPAVYKFFSRALNEALEDGASGIIILLDTPGGLDLAM